MRKSDVFDSFVKIALEKGLISEDAPEKAKKKLESNPRADSLDISAIEALYGVKPNALKGMEYKRNIIENAHPESVIIAPSYDKLHGLVENENERQDISINIINRMPDGNITQHKYAEHDLLMTLVRVGNELDNQNKHELRALSDVCLEQVSSITTIKKRALIPAIALAAGAALGALWLQQHMPFISENFTKDYQKLMAEIEDVLNQGSSWQNAVGAGVDYTPEFLAIVKDLKAKLVAYNDVFKRVSPHIMNFKKPQSSDELLKASQGATGQNAVKAQEIFTKATSELIVYLEEVRIKFSDTNFKSQQIANKGFLTSLVDKTHITHSENGLVSDDISDIARAIPAFETSMRKIETLLEQSTHEKEVATQQLAAASTVGKPEAETPKEEAKDPVAEEDEHAGKLNREFEGFKF
jgi:hypothetical protein